MRVFSSVRRSWSRLSITTKFSLAFGLLLAVLVLGAASSYLTLNTVRRKTETSILNSTHIQQLVLRMDRGLETARRLQRDFFLLYPSLGLAAARTAYAQPALDQIQQVVALSAELRTALAQSNMGDAVQVANLDLYLRASQRYSDTFRTAVDLVTQLADDPNGLQPQLQAESDQLGAALRQTGRADWLGLYLDMELAEKDYALTERRSTLQSALNSATQLQQALSISLQAAPAAQVQAQAALVAYTATAQQIATVNTSIAGLLNDFELQAQTVDPISQSLIRLADQEVLRAQQQVEQINQLATATLAATTLGGLALAWLIATLLNHSVTRIVIHLTRAAADIRAGRLDVSAPVDSDDELGELARTFNSMAAQLQTSFTSLRASEARFRSLFEDSPISLWEEDGSQLKAHLDELRASGVADWRAYFTAHPAELPACAALIRVVDVNRATAALLQADASETVLANLQHIFSDQSYAAFADELVALASGQPTFEAELVHQTLRGQQILVNLRLSVVPGYEDTWTKLLVSLTDITERKRVELALQEKEQRYRALFECTTDAVFVISLDGVHQLVNQQAADLLGYMVEELVGMPTSRIVVPDEYPDSQQRLAALLAGQSMPVHERTFRRKDGTDIQVEINLALVRDAAGRPLHFQSVTRDITARKQTEALIQTQYRQLQAQNDELTAQEKLLRQAEAELRQANVQLEARVAARTAELSLANEALARAARMKDEFLASMSHELRTPLTGILGLSETLQMGIYGPLADPQVQPLRHIHQSGEHLLNLITDILDLSKIEAGKMELDVGPVVVDSVCQNSLQLIGELANKKSLRVSYQRDMAVDLVLADERRLKQMIVNLLSNAVKFTPDGGAVGLEVKGDAADQRVRFTVWDTGLGVSPDNQSRLFKPFVQLDSRLSRQFNGTGLGLSLVARMAELHGGSVSVESDGVPGQGSRFSFTLPWTAVPLTPARRAEQRLALQQALIVEDTPVAAEQLRLYLAELGISSQVQSSGLSVLETVLAASPDVILLDLLLPGRSGWDVLADLKADRRTAAVPVVVVSVIDDRPRAEKLGAEGYLVKPVALSDLQRALDAAQARARQKVAPLAVAGAVDGRPRVLVADDNEITLSTLKDFLHARGYQVELARNGLQALENAQQTRPALILMDMQMPDLDGLEATRRLRASPDSQLVATPVIALTALAMPGDRERCLAAGADDYLFKPINLEKLAQTIEARLAAGRGAVPGAGRPA
jgi:PAS domain S-box-containing protein